ncbi:response regulator transcription factor [Pseudomonas sp. Q1]|uniref:response regulator transcription factor n=1 Tax=Pseudomonas sp. Q1 TaxID=2202823 RepID=UPI0013750D75|nr:response regulator transcription factor [Pseudomonas sp. Q1]NCE88461.1 DNA-binding response regulator [Pseudomonas sp. Q1]
MNSKVMIIDDHPAVRMAVRFLLETEGYEIVGDAENVAEALELIEQVEPEILILDIGLPNTDGLTLIHQMVAKNVPVRIIVLTAQQTHPVATHCKEAGAHGFVSKRDDLCELTNAVRVVKSGDTYFPQWTLNPPRQTLGPNNDKALLKTLSARELSVLHQLTQGLRNKEIAENLLLNSKTVSTYKTRVLHKLKSNSLLDLYELAKRNGLVTITRQEYLEQKYRSVDSGRFGADT